MVPKRPYYPVIKPIPDNDPSITVRQEAPCEQPET